MVARFGAASRTEVEPVVNFVLGTMSKRRRLVRRVISEPIRPLVGRGLLREEYSNEIHVHRQIRMRDGTQS